MSLLGLLAYNNKFRILFTYFKVKKMRQCEATEGDIRLRRGARIKRKDNKAGLCVEESRSAPPCFGM